MYILTNKDVRDRKSDNIFNENDVVDTSKVTNMRCMFYAALAFNHPLGDKFNTSNVTNMGWMFSEARAFNQPLGDKFDTSNVTDMKCMFGGADSFNQPLGDKFDTSNVTDMYGMFSGAHVFNQPLGYKFDTSKVTDMRWMFDGAKSMSVVHIYRMITDTFTRYGNRKVDIRDFTSDKWFNDYLKRLKADSRCITEHSFGGFIVDI